MGILPATGTTISMGRTGHAYNNVGAGGQSVGFNGNTTMNLNAQIGRASGSNTSFSAVFGGRTTPFDY